MGRARTRSEDDNILDHTYGARHGNRVDMADRDRLRVLNPHIFFSPTPASASSWANFGSRIVRPAPVSSIKSYGPEPLMMTGTTISEHSAIFILAVMTLGAGPVSSGGAAMLEDRQ